MISPKVTQFVKLRSYNSNASLLESAACPQINQEFKVLVLLAIYSALLALLSAPQEPYNLHESEVR